MGEKRVMAIIWLASIYLATVLTESPAVDVGVATAVESSPEVDSSSCIEPKHTLCPKNEERRCQNPCPPETCVTLYAAFLCIQNQTCVDGCHCKKGFLRIGKNGPCVPRDQCNPLECVDDPNAERGCGDKCGKTCNDYKNKTLICPKRPCKDNECACKEGYIYDTNINRCVKPKDCTKPCRPNERYSTCLISECVPKTCADVGYNLACPAIAADPCPGGCICDYGYIKDKDGKCVDAKTCPSCGGDPNAIAGCGNPCGKTCADLNTNKSDSGCAQYCESNGCDCKDGYLLNTDLKPPRCVLVKDCPKKCGNNEEFYCGPSCPGSEPSCANPNPPICINKRCENKCYCKKGFVRDANNNCIPADQCNSCPKNEVRRCQYPCPPDTCLNIYVAIDCMREQTCVDGCYCKEGYLRIGRKGPCVPRDQCNPIECVDDPNAQRGCGLKCGKTCTDYNNKTKICPKGPCNENGCDCKEGYVYDQNVNLCVKPKDCTAPCKVNERYSTCLLADCVPKTCADVGFPVACPAIAADPCPGGCTCDYGYVKDKNGKCVDAKTCPSCGRDPNAIAGCGNTCGKTCADLNTNKSNLICPQFCDSNGCDCKEGYLLDTGLKPPRCVLVKDCPKPPNTCGKNEEFYCGPSCPDSEPSCAKPNPPVCINKKCENKCFCKKGFVRDVNNACIPTDKCPKQCTKPHERYTECMILECVPKNCDDLDKPISCPFIPGPCNDGGCVCEQGYGRLKNGTCVKYEDCPPKPCGANQTWMSPCNAPCPYPRCPRNDKPPPECTPILPCYPGCQCKLNYLRNATGQCILAPDCPPVNCTRQNEVWDSCPSACLAESCDDVNNQPKTCNTLIWLCNPRCVCKKGHFRNKDGLCVPASQCPAVKCTKPNEKYIDCLAGQCQPKTCDELINPPGCPRVIPPCPGGCICVEGYVRNAKGECIKEENCPNLCTKPNERYSKCTLGECIPKRCDDLGFPIACPGILPPCPGGCLCKKGYVWDKNGTCIDAKTCPSCGGDPNAIAGCGNTCGKTCADLNTNKSNLICPQYCDSNGCDCKDGYLLDTGLKPPRCVLVKDCPKPPNTCGNNEEFYCGPSCPDSEPSCAKPNPPVCINKKCENKCFCKKGFVRDANNACIPADKCPAVKCTKPNEKYIDCLAGQCQPKTCDELINPPGCPRVIPPCPGGCICVEGYVRNAKGECIKEENCPNLCTKPNERYSKCTLGECIPKRCDDLGFPIACPGILPPCPGGCLCKEGYVWDKNGTCIDAKTCPSCGGDPNAQAGCSNPCGRTCASLQINSRKKRDTANTAAVQCATYCVENGCDCKKGYILNTNLDPPRCVLPEDCNKPLNCTGANEQYSDCVQSQCSPTTCKEIVKLPICPTTKKPCSGGCICKHGFVRSNNGTCIAISNCPENGTCTDPNQAWTQCAVNCANAYCPKDDQPQPLCFLPVGICQPGCKCKPNYRIDKNNKCIPARDCPAVPCTRPNEEYNSCPGNRITSCALLGTSATAVASSGPKICNPGCICKQGFYQNSNGTCVPKCECDATAEASTD